jgi:hypothetical protein
MAMLNLTGKWRVREGSPIFEVEHDVEDPRKFSFFRADGDRKSFFGQGQIQGEQAVISWRSTMWLGHGSDESRLIDLDRLTNKPIEIHWKEEMAIWQTLSN